MKFYAQSLIEFAIILLVVTVIAMGSLQIISYKINSTTYVNYEESQSTLDDVQTTEEENCTKMGLHWDKKNSVCEAN